MEKIRDTIPESLKKHFYTGKTVPNLSKDYDAVGFDADHCLVKYNVLEVTKFLVKLQLKDLEVHEGWPSEINDFDLEGDEIKACLNYSVFDVDKGLVLKLGENKQVLAAMRGRKTLSLQEIQKEYGENCIFPKLEWPNLYCFD